MKLPEWKPLPHHIARDDSDTRGLAASLALIIPVVSFIGSALLIILALLL